MFNMFMCFGQSKKTKLNKLDELNIRELRVLEENYQKYFIYLFTK